MLASYLQETFEPTPSPEAIYEITPLLKYKQSSQNHLQFAESSQQVSVIIIESVALSRNQPVNMPASWGKVTCLLLLQVLRSPEMHCLSVAALHSSPSFICKPLVSTGWVSVLKYAL